jgi:hypothetical protein
VGRLLHVLSDSGEISEDRLADLEFIYLPVTQQHGRGRPKILHRKLERDPDFFAEVVALAYKAEDEGERELSEDEVHRAQLAHELLESWRTIPGLREDGAVDSEALSSWVKCAIAAVEARNRRVGDYLIGQHLRYSPADDDGTWPARPVRDLIEDLASEDLGRGLEVEVYNSRGVTTRSPTAGGGQERALVEQYTGWATNVSAEWPRTAAMLRRIAGTYERDARREDDSAELTEDLWN